MEKNRLRWVDTAKGIAILGVVIAHSRMELNLISKIIIGCHMPLFFFLSGITLNCQREFGLFVRKKAKSLLWPYFTVSSIYIVVTGLLQICNGNYMMVVVNIYKTISFQGIGVLWFLPTLFFADIFVWVINQIHGKWVLKLVFLGVIIIFGSIYNEIVQSYCCLGILYRIFVGAFFVYSGYIGNNFITITKIHISLSVCALVAYIFLCKKMTYWFSYDLRMGLIPNIFVYLLLAYLGIVVCIGLCQTISLDWLQEIGKNSLIIYCTHLPIVLFCERIFSNFFNKNFAHVLIAGFSIICEMGILFIDKKSKIINNIFYFPCKNENAK